MKKEKNTDIVCYFDGVKHVSKASNIVYPNKGNEMKESTVMRSRIKNICIATSFMITLLVAISMGFVFKNKSDEAAQELSTYLCKMKSVNILETMGAPKEYIPEILDKLFINPETIYLNNEVKIMSNDNSYTIKYINNTEEVRFIMDNLIINYDKAPSKSVMFNVLKLSDNKDSIISNKTKIDNGILKLYLKNKSTPFEFREPDNSNISSDIFTVAAGMTVAIAIMAVYFSIMKVTLTKKTEEIE